MPAINLFTQPIRITALALAHVFCLALAVYSAGAKPAEVANAREPLRLFSDSDEVDELEKMFWLCDHTATRHGVHAAPVELCSAVYYALRDQKFGGDFAELLSWWLTNKQNEHSALSRASGDLVSR